MRRILFIAFFAVFLLAGVAQAEDYWIFVNTEDQSGVSSDDDKGLAKAGDVADVISVSRHPVLSKKEKQNWKVIKVSNLTEKQRLDLTAMWGDPNAKEGEKSVLANRRNKLDLTLMGLSSTKGEESSTKDASEVVITEKTQIDLAVYATKQLAYRYVHRPMRQINNAIARAVGVKKAFATENISSIGATGRDYTTCNLWEDAVDGDLVTATSQETGETYNDSGLIATTKCVIDGSTTDATYYMKLTSATSDRHDGTAGNGAGFTQAANGSTDYVLQIDDNYTVVSWLEFEGYAGGAGPDFIIRPGLTNNGADNLVLHNNIIHQFDATSGSAVQIQGDNSVSMYNNIVYDTPNRPCVYHVSGTDDHFYFYNNTVYGCRWGVIQEDAQIWGHGINNIVYNNSTSDISGNWDTDTDYNLCEKTSCPGTNSQNNADDGVTPDFVSTTGGSEDFHLTSTSDAIDFGTDLGAGDFSVDIDGRDRDAEADVWDAGAHEFVAAGGGGGGGERRVIFISQNERK